MSKKMQLPDELLDVISGGLLTYQGKVITGVRMYTDLIEVQVEGSSDSVSLKWNEAADARTKTLGSYSDFMNEINGKGQDGNVHRLEDYVK